MKDNLLQEFDTQISNLDEKERAKLRIDVLQRLIRKLENDEDAEISQALENLIREIPSSPFDPKTRKIFLKSLISIQKKVTKAFQYVERGSVKSGYVGAWAAIGITVGAAVGSTYGGTGEGAGIGVVVFLIIGVLIGIAKERKAENEGLTY